MREGPPRIFLLPSIFGDEPPLADFRAALAGRIDFELLDYPDIDRPSSEIRDFAGILDRTTERIRALQPSGDLYIAGYSFGGLVGFVAGCRLQEEGRRVKLLTLLDSRALSLKVPRADSGNSEAAPGPWGLRADFASRLLIAAGLAEVVRALISPAGKLFGAGAARGLRRLLLQNLRGRSLRNLSLGHFDGPLLLFRAEEQPVSDLPSDLGWSAHCSSMRSVPIRGNHDSLFRVDHLAANAELIGAAIEAQIGR